MQCDYQRLAWRSYTVVMCSYLGLLVVFTLNTLIWPSCNRQPNTVIWLIHIVPMLLFLPGLLKRQARTHVWLSFISLGYFLAAVPLVYVCFSPLPIIETLLIVQLFISTMLYARWRSRELSTAVQQHQSPGSQTE